MIGLTSSSTHSFQNITGFWLLSLVVAMLPLLSCTINDRQDTKGDLQEVRINLKTEPDRLHPILSRQLSARQVERFIFNSLEEYNPLTLQLEPMLLKEKPITIPIDTGQYVGGVQYELIFREEATWDNGSPITGFDYLFTIKSLFNPYLASRIQASYLESLAEVYVDSLEPKKIIVITHESYMYGEEVICGIQVYPEHVYDPDRILSAFTLQEIRDHDLDNESVEADMLRDFAEQLSNSKNSREIVNGSGPYQLVEWTANQQIVLQKKADHWTHNLTPLHPLLQANPERLVYYIIPDEQTAFTNLKAGNLDIMSDVLPEQLNSILGHEEQLNLRSYTPSVLQYYFIAYNNQHFALKDRKVRTAISHLMDVESLIKELFFGQATPTIGPVNPAKPYYHHSLDPLKLDIGKAKGLLAESGWVDQNNDGIRDKMIDDKLRSLHLRIYTTRSQLSQDVAVLLQANARKAGVEIEVIPNEISVFLPEMRKGNFEMATLASVQTLGYTDPYNTWHSDNAGPTGSNLCKLESDSIDRVIENIRTTLDESERNNLYLDFQRLIYQEQPALFLLSPKTRLIASARLNLVTSTMRPGYFENLVTLK